MLSVNGGKTTNHRQFATTLKTFTVITNNIRSTDSGKKMILAAHDDQKKIARHIHCATR
jgi:hypothetical protein